MTTKRKPELKNLDILLRVKGDLNLQLNDVQALQALQFIHRYMGWKDMCDIINVGIKHGSTELKDRILMHTNKPLWDVYDLVIYIATFANINGMSHEQGKIEDF